MQEIFDVPIEAKLVRISPQTWHNGIALRVELIGCGHRTTTPPYEFLTTAAPAFETAKPIFCNDEMGVNNNKMSPTQYSVSSELGPENSKHRLKVDDPSAWQPLTNSPTEFVQFDFLESRNLTGKG